MLHASKKTIPLAKGDSLHHVKRYSDYSTLITEGGCGSTGRRWGRCGLMLASRLCARRESPKAGWAALILDAVSAGQVATAPAIGNHQTGQIAGFVAGAGVVATVGSYRTLGIDTFSFGISALILMTAVRARPAPQRATGNGRPCDRSRRMAFGSCSGDPAAWRRPGLWAGSPWRRARLSRAAPGTRRLWLCRFSGWPPGRVARSGLSRRRPVFLSGLDATTGAC
jgi:hypothetical protein